MKTIIAIVGESGSGKTWLTRKLHNEGIIENIVSYTTRPMRETETNGVEHWFVPEATYYNCVEGRELLAYTYFGGNHYWTFPDQISKEACTYVIDEKGLVELKSKWSDRFNIISVYVTRPNNPTDEERKNRDKDRISLDKYDYYIENDGTINFYNKGRELLKTIQLQLFNNYFFNKTTV